MDRDFSEETMRFERKPDDDEEAREVLFAVYNALKEKGYNPINQMVGYLLSGDPVYITGYKNARSIMRRIERDELLEELLRKYLADHSPTKK
ncbi:MAG: IreB family regulatory phosphoprotein [Desulforudis sp.]|jgi:uncharacterized protein (UPF0297 family)|nr:IreB family regulatory phosphoprotein [Clostridia bacterium]MDQ7790858.1 IreB family regulatory phosphoprotein [Clostridia bacterium]RJX22008.1 MAG: IreB family regulatory phosphoprotein [Desulforudis sp.]